MRGAPREACVEGRVAKRCLEPVAMPYLGRMIVVPAVLAHAFALAGLVSRWSDHRAPWAAVALLVVSMALPLILVVVSRRSGGRLPVGALMVVVTGVFGVSVVVPALLPPEPRSSLQSWSWGTGAMTFLGIAAYLSTRRTASLALAQAATGQLDAERGRHELDAVRLAGDRLTGDRRLGELWFGELRLGELREEIEPLLRHVVDGGQLPLDAVRARRAQLLAERLRAALLAQRRALWLPDQVGEAPVTVVCSDVTAGRIGTEQRAWLATLLELLEAYPRWRAVRVVLDPAPGGAVTAVVTAEGEAAAEAVSDPRVRALAASVGARAEIDGRFLSIDADLHVMIGA